MKKIFVWLLIVTILASSLLTGCRKEEEMPEFIETEPSETQEKESTPTKPTEIQTIPTIETQPQPTDAEDLADKYPNKYGAALPEIPTQVTYETGATIQLSDEDLAIFEHYSEAYCCLVGNNGSPDYDPSDLPFLRCITAEEIIKSNTERGDKTTITHCQLLSAWVKADGSVEVGVLVENYGYILETGINTYWGLKKIQFEKCVFLLFLLKNSIRVMYNNRNISQLPFGGIT